MPGKSFRIDFHKLVIRLVALKIANQGMIIISQGIKAQFMSILHDENVHLKNEKYLFSLVLFFLSNLNSGTNQS
ncbi:MAG TPA: hypothetical protein DHV17_01240 [Chitinophagaceae bacterium]|nr:hypothetical protein [Chitinophagaceae bacterium]